VTGSERDARARAIARLYYADELTMEQIGELYGITRERVRVILDSVQPEPGGRQALAGRRASAKAARRAESLREEIERLYRELGNVESVRKRLRIDTAVVSRTVEEAFADDPLERLRVMKQNWIAAGDRRRRDDDIVFDHMRRLAGGDVLTGEAWDAYALANDLPGKQTMTIRYGTWTAALDAAGVKAGRRGFGGPRRYEDDDLVAAVSRAWDAVGRPPSMGDYQRVTGNRPSAASIRNRIGRGRWTDVIERVAETRKEA
jgi:Sigma-70, region 4